MDIKLSKDEEIFILKIKEKGVDVTREEIADVGDIILGSIK